LKWIDKYCPFLLNILLFKIKFGLKYILKYRHKVIINNLKNSFGRQLSEARINEIQNKYYDVLVRYIRESVYIAIRSEIALLSAIKIDDKVQWNDFLNADKSTILLASHYGNWEMNMVLLPKFIKHKVVAFYKPISDKNTDDLMKEIRSAYGLLLYTIDQTARVMELLKNEHVVYVFIGDQSPLNMNGVYWNTFLTQKTPWMTGAEKLAKKYNYPVIYLEQRPNEPTQNGYKLSLHNISSHPTSEKEGMIIQKYSEILEEEIINKPEFWLWSHKRWKRAN
jgi:KDO2-lipid IV(A) lauroyltransferase